MAVFLIKYSYFCRKMIPCVLRLSVFCDYNCAVQCYPSEDTWNRCQILPWVFGWWPGKCIPSLRFHIQISAWPVMDRPKVIIRGAFHTCTFIAAVRDRNMLRTSSCCELVEKGKNYKRPQELLPCHCWCQNSPKTALTSYPVSVIPYWHFQNWWNIPLITSVHVICNISLRNVTCSFQSTGLS